MRALTRTVLASTLAFVALSGLGSTALAAGDLTVTVPYPGVVVGPGSKVTFDVTIKTSGCATATNGKATAYRLTDAVLGKL